MGRIIVIEPELIIALNIKLILQKRGLTIISVVKNFEEAKDLLAYNEISMIIWGVNQNCDIELGYIKDLREVKIQVIYIVSLIDKDLILAAGNSDCSYFILKPFKEKGIVDVLNILGNNRSDSISILKN